MLQVDELRQELRATLNPVITKNTHSISKTFAKRVTSDNNQSVSLMVVGPMGSGKSSSTITLGINAAIEISKIKGGHWTKYFNIDHIGVLTKEEIYRTIEIDQKYAVVMPDDVGAAWNARRFADAGNIMMNDILQTSRTQNQILLMTLPDSILIDRVPRALVQHFMVMDPPLFNQGITVGRFYNVKRAPRENKTYFIFNELNGMRYQRVLFGRPPKFFVDEYEKKRRDIAHEFKQKSLADRLAKVEGKKVDKPKPKTKKEKILKIYEDLNAGVYHSLRDGLVKNDMAKDLNYARNVISQNFGGV